MKEIRITRQQLDDHRRAMDDIIAGKRHPTMYELGCGFPIAKHDVMVDFEMWARENAPMRQSSRAVHLHYRNAAKCADAETLNKLWQALHANCRHGENYELIDRLRVYRAIDHIPGYDDPAQTVVRHAIGLAEDYARRAPLWALRARAYAIALLDMSFLSRSPERVYELTEHMLRQGRDMSLAVLGAEAPSRPSLRELGPAEERREPEGPGLVVVRSLPETGREIDMLQRQFGNRVGKRIPLMKTPDVSVARGTLTAEAPHLAPAIDAILRSTAGARTVRLRPTILVGAPGSGKTRLARRIAEVLGVPATVYPAGGAMDASLAGTSRQWGSGRPSVPLQAILRTGVANPVIVVDEIDKASPDPRNGRLVDALLGMLEPSTSKLWLDPYLETDVDLSAVSWLLTANDDEGIPQPLRDRCRIVHVPEPAAVHATAVVRSVLREVAADRDIDPIWLPELTPDAVGLIARAWNGGSVRRLRRCVEAWVDAHDALHLAH